MSTRKAEEDLWEYQKATLHDLYIDQDVPLKELIATMTSCHGFKKTKAQYERVFREWKWKKNTTANVWKFVGHRIHKRKVEGKISLVKINGTVVTKERLRKEVARYDVGHAFRALLSPQTPPNILVSTPRSSTDSVERESILTPQPMPFSLEQLVQLAQNTPWKFFREFIEKLYEPDPALDLTISQQSSTLDAISRINLHQARGQDRSVEPFSLRMTDLMQDWLDDLTLFTYTQEEPGLFTTFSYYLDPTPILPSLNIGNLPRKPIEVSPDLTRRSTQLEWLKMVVFLMSNNHGDESLVFAFVELCQDKVNHRLLRRLLHEDYLSVAAFAEKLLTPAVSVGDMTLLMLLLESGVSPNAKGCSNKVFSCSPLRCAICGGRTAFVKALLDHGADPSRLDVLSPILWSNSRRLLLHEVSDLDLAALQGNIAIVEEIMLPRTPFKHSIPTITLFTICLAIEENHLSMLHLLLRRNPSLVQSLIKESARILELAAYNGHVEMIDALMKYGADVEKSDDGKGSALAAAVYGGHTRTVHHILSFERSINGISAWAQLREIDPYEAVFAYRLDDIGLSSLAFAALAGNEEIVELLLVHGADTNQSLPATDVICMPTSIQIAAWKGTKRIVRALLKAGANPNQQPSYFPRLVRTTEADAFHCIRSVEGKTALQLAMERGNYEIMQLLLQYGATLRATSEVAMDNLIAALRGQDSRILDFVFGLYVGFDDPATALQACIEYGRFDLAHQIPAESFVTNHPGPLCAAVYRRDSQLVNMLLSGASAMRERFPVYAASGLAMAARLCDLEMIELFLNADAKPYFRVHRDVYRVGKPNIPSGADLELLKGTCAIEEVAKIEPSDEAGRARHFAAAEVLLGSCAVESETDGPIMSIEIQRALNQALRPAVAARNWQIVRLLLRYGANATTQYEDGATCFQYAIGDAVEEISDDHYQVIELLLESGAEPSITCRRALTFGRGGNATIQRIFGLTQCSGFSDNTPFQNAVKTNQIDVVRLLLHHGATVNAAPREIRGATALQYAAIQGNFEITNSLLQAGAEVNAERGYFNGRTAIEGAAEWGRLDMVKYLLTLGADVKGRHNGQYRRAVYRAWEQGHMTLIRMLQDFKAEKYGREDCCSVEEIVDTMCDDELLFADYTERRNFHH